MPGDDFSIACVTNPAMSFKLDASTLTIRGTRKLKDAHGSHVILNLKHSVSCPGARRGAMRSQALSAWPLANSGACCS